MKIVNESLELVKVEAIRQHPRNPRKGDVDAISRSISANGWYGAIVVQKSTGYILAGNHRYLAARKTGAQKVPVLWVEVDEETATRILLADNRTNDLADYDKPRLTELLSDILEETRSLAGTGYITSDLEKLIAETTGDPLEGTLAGDQTGEIDSQFQVIVSCKSEQQQTELLVRLTEDGYSCRALIS